jgi:hypothetical protein
LKKKLYFITTTTFTTIYTRLEVDLGIVLSNSIDVVLGGRVFERSIRIYILQSIREFYLIIYQTTGHHPLLFINTEQKLSYISINAKQHTQNRRMKTCKQTMRTCRYDIQINMIIPSAA